MTRKQLSAIGCGVFIFWGVIFVTDSFREEKLFIMAGQSNMMLMPERYLAQNLPPRSSILNVARAGTSLAQWSKGSPLYTLMLWKIRNENIPVAANFFWQGEEEGDSMFDLNAGTWAKRFTQFVKDVRADLHDPRLMIVFVKIGKNTLWGKEWDVVRAQQEKVRIDRVYMVRCADAEQDGIHFTEAGYKLVAQRIAQAYADHVGR